MWPGEKGGPMQFNPVWNVGYWTVGQSCRCAKNTLGSYEQVPNVFMENYSAFVSPSQLKVDTS